MRRSRFTAKSVIGEAISLHGQKELNVKQTKSQECTAELLSVLSHVISMHVEPSLLIESKEGSLIAANQAAKKSILHSNDAVLPARLADAIKTGNVLQTILQIMEAFESNGPDAQKSIYFGIPADSDSLPKNVIARQISIPDKNLSYILILLRDPIYDVDFLKRRSENMSYLSHSIRSCLTTIQGFSELLIHRSFDRTNETKFLNYINEQGVKLAKLIESLEAIVHHEGGRELRLLLEKHSLNEVLKEAVLRALHVHPERNIELSLPGVLPHCLMNDERMADAFHSILDNALRYTEGDVVLHGETNLSEPNCKIMISDKGPGMAPDEISKAFEPFYIGEKTDTNDERLGLGLPVARHIVESHGGKFKLESSPSGGTRVIIELPVER